MELNPLGDDAVVLAWDGTAAGEALGEVRAAVAAVVQSGRAPTVAGLRHEDVRDDALRVLENHRHAAGEFRVVHGLHHEERAAAVKGEHRIAAPAHHKGAGHGGREGAGLPIGVVV